MSSVVSFGTNTNAQRKRVMYVGTSVIYEGMPVCYDDSTTNVLGIDTGASNAVSTTTTEGGQNEGKFLRVENPDADNIGLFAGVVAHGPKVGTTGVATGVWLDVFIPNGAIVPVRAGVACTTRRTVLSVISATQYLGHPLSGTQARPVAIAEETYDRSTAGLVLAKLDTNMFIYQDATGDALYAGVGATAAAADQVVNRINISTAQTGGQFHPVYIRGDLLAGCTGTTEYGMVQIEEYLHATALSGNCSALGVAVQMASGLVDAAGAEIHAAILGIEDWAGVAKAGMVLSVLKLESYISSAGTAPAMHTMMQFNTNSAGDTPDYWFWAQNIKAIACTYDPSGDENATKVGDIKIHISGDIGTGYIRVYDGVS